MPTDPTSTAGTQDAELRMAVLKIQQVVDDLAAGDPYPAVGTIQHALEAYGDARYEQGRREALEGRVCTIPLCNYCAVIRD